MRLTIFQVMILMGIPILGIKAIFSPYDMIQNWNRNNYNDGQDGFSKSNFSQDSYEDYYENPESTNDLVQESSVFEVRNKV